MNPERRELELLLSQRLGVDINYDDFQGEFEHLYNFRIAEDEFSEAELDALADLFKIVAWYTPVQEDRESYPRHFKSERDVDLAVARARGILDIKERQG